MAKTKEPQYASFLELRDEKGMARFGLMSNQVWRDDPKRVTFTLSRYKFVAKMLSGKKRVLEVGCADGFASRIVRQEVNHLTAVDFDPIFIEDARGLVDPKWPIDLAVHDMVEGPYPGVFDAVYAVDVFEHIDPRDERRFLQHMVTSLSDDGVAIIGIPSLESQTYASPISKTGHVNCKQGPEFERIMREYFRNVFMFSMNDELVHTGFSAMAHYLFAIACSKK